MIELKPARSLRVLATIAMTIASFLISCGGPATPPSARTEPAAPGVADVAFATNMIPHHQQAVVLAAMVPAHTANATLRAMATQIGADQQAEIRTLDGLLTDWRSPAVDPGVMSPTGGEMPMAGMVDQATLDRLQSLEDDAFDTLWVRSMIGHHQGAIAMAQDELAHGRSPDAIHVATLIITAQQREIAMMTHLISASQ